MLQPEGLAWVLTFYLGIMPVPQMRQVPGYIWWHSAPGGCCSDILMAVLHLLCKSWFILCKGRGVWQSEEGQGSKPESAAHLGDWLGAATASGCTYLARQL